MRRLICTTAFASLGFGHIVHGATFTLYDDKTDFLSAVTNTRTENFSSVRGQSFSGVPLTSGEVTLLGQPSPSISGTGSVLQFPSVGAFTDAPEATVDGAGPVLSFGEATAFGADFASLRTEFSATSFKIGDDVVSAATLVGELQSYDGFFGFTSDTPFSSVEFIDTTQNVPDGDLVVFDNLLLGDAVPQSDPDPDPGNGGPSLPYRLFMDRAAFEAALKDTTIDTLNDVTEVTPLGPGPTQRGSLEFSANAASLEIEPNPLVAIDGTPAIVANAQFDPLGGGGFVDIGFDQQIIGFGADFASLSTELGGTQFAFLTEVVGPAFFDGVSSGPNALYDGFFGFISDDPFDALRIVATTGPDRFEIDNITFSAQLASTHEPQVIPLPASALLLVAGLGGLFAIRCPWRRFQENPIDA